MKNNIKYILILIVFSYSYSDTYCCDDNMEKKIWNIFNTLRMSGLGVAVVKDD